MNGQGGGRSILVLYRIVNSDSDASDPSFNCFQMPYGSSGPTLSLVKQHCAAAHSLSHLGPEGYHWRVLVEEKAGSSGERSFSWWDIQDGNAKLPVKETTQGELRKLLYPSKSSSHHSSSDSATKAAKGAFKMMAKAAAHAIGDDGGVENSGPPVSVLTFKLLDLVKLHDDAAQKHGGGVAPQPRPRRAPAPRPAQQPRAPQPRPPQPRPHAQRAQTAPRPSAPAPAPSARQTSANLMDFGDSPAPTASSGARTNPRVLHHTNSSPAMVNPNETRAQRLKREQEQRMKNKNRVWDEVDQRWVEVDPRGGTKQGTTSAPPSAVNQPKKKEIGIKLDANNIIGKSDHVAQKMHERISKMEENAAKAVAENRAREEEKKRKEEEEDKIRVQLEPKIKAWSEEYGKKKQLRALLASLHTILWPGAKWKQISIGDIMADAKVKKFYLKATLVVHPDKTGDLPADQRFLAKRIFDALAQAKADFDNGKS